MCQYAQTLHPTQITSSSPIQFLYSLSNIHITLYSSVYELLRIYLPISITFNRGHYVGIHASGFKDFILKPECLRAVVDCGFEHPSEVQHECIPQAVLGMDIIW